jgi:hypothetical protein
VSDEKTEAIRRKNNDTVTKPFTLPLQNINIVKHTSFKKLKSPNTREKTLGLKIINVDFELNLFSDLAVYSHGRLSLSITDLQILF